MALGLYVFAHFAALLVLTAVALARVNTLGTAGFALVAVFVTLSLVVLSRLLEQRRGARVLEAGRVLLLLALGAVYGGNLFAILGNA